MAFDGNSHREKDAKDSRPPSKQRDEMKPVADGKIEKKGGFLASLLKEDGDNIREYFFETIVIPGILDAISGIGGIVLDSVTDTIELLFENKGYSGSSKWKSKGHTNYSSISSNKSRKSSRYRRDDDDEDDDNEDDSEHSYDNVHVKTEREAQEVKRRLQERIEETGYATVANLYQLTGNYHTWTDSEKGWTSLNSMSWTRTRNRKRPYLLILPRPKDIRDLK